MELKSPHVPSDNRDPLSAQCRDSLYSHLAEGPWEGEVPKESPEAEVGGASRQVSFLPLGWLTVDKWMSIFTRDRIYPARHPL